MSLRKRIKANARRALGGSWGRAICILLVSLSIVVIFSLLQTIAALVLDVPDFHDMLATPDLYLDDSANLSFLSIGLSAAFTLLSLIVNAPLELGVRMWYYHIASGESDDVVSIFSFFAPARLFFKSVWYSVSLSLRLALWGVLFYLPPCAVGVGSVLMLRLASLQDSEGMRLGGILLAMLGVMLLVLCSVFLSIFSNRYFLAPYLLADRPGIGVRQAFKTSVRYMNGHRTEIFTLRLSFLPWSLLMAFVLPLLYIVPYYHASLALYAKYLIERGRLCEPEDETMRFDIGERRDPGDPPPEEAPPA